MADEKYGADQTELDEVSENIEEAADQAVVEAVAAVIAEEPAEEPVEQPAEEPVEEQPAEEPVEEQLDERVEAAVRHVAEEAEEEEVTSKKRERRSKQARAAKAERTGEAATSTRPEPAKVGGLQGLGVGAWIGISLACLALGCVLGRFVLGGGSSTNTTFGGSTTVTEAQLDDVFATYTYNGKPETISVREVIEQTSTLDDAKGEDGNYTLPSAEYAVTVARNKILMGEVESRGITVSDDDVKAYAEENLGTNDFEALGSTYGMDAAMVEQLIRENCLVNALREEVVGGEVPAMPEAPEAAEEGKEDETTKAYAKYIIKLAGDEWDKDAGTWADAEGRYATALADYTVTNKAASYNAAEAAYYVAYQIYTEKQTEISEKWTEFFNGLMSNASIQVATLVS